MTVRKRRRTMADVKRNPPPDARGHKPAAPRKTDREGMEQRALMLWLYGEHMRGSEVGGLWPVTYHVPNGGQRSKKTAADLKREGVKAGVSDLVVMSGRGGWNGMYLEFKASPPNHAATAASQRTWLALADGEGYAAVLARGLDEAKQVLTWYASLPRTVIEQAKQECPHGTEWRK